jgi:hypothetical protein
MTAARTKKTKTTVKAAPAAQWRGRVEAADWTTIGTELNTASALASMTCWERAKHSPQTYTPGPAASVAASMFDFAQNEQAAERGSRIAR